ncbi:energy-coupling factor ABC transporter substrate-binding protein [Thioalkalivibrio thiocyanodenitrificans]|uniref:energy-coupling factor ABC transporter substrate-binding protein n=1 Tax=Thioalkalivibrio thiocyanodenitrificans TaxID=243063 RepID=UPI000525E3DF|nr:energy-coupling factor ABC transporter substrate-binding protein [Thioalkalivibrio thiocyanodenitrificans]
MSTRMNFILLLAAALIVAAPLLLSLPGDYEGADDMAQAAIEETGYEPWFEPLWSPPSDEVESMFFALQAAGGAGLLGFVLGRVTARRGRKPDER